MHPSVYPTICIRSVDHDILYNIRTVDQPGVLDQDLSWAGSVCSPK